MEDLFERLLTAFRAKWWKLVAAACIGAVGSLVAIGDSEQRPANVLPYVAGGAAIGFIAGLFLLWVDAGQARRELRNDKRPLLRERALIGCLVVGLGLGVLSVICAALMGIVHVVEFFRR